MSDLSTYQDECRNIKDAIDAIKGLSDAGSLLNKTSIWRESLFSERETSDLD